MYKKYKQIIKKHVKIIKSKHPEIYIEVTMTLDNILVGIGSQDLSKAGQYDALINDFIDEYDRKGLYNIFWAVDSSVAKDNLYLLEYDVKTPEEVFA